ncbi:MAG: ribosome maturation factor RimM [Methylococcales bacterium]|nr:ribosome maturation factor RimM [Methylococcales bacterium]MCK5924325.1 ribosome maturation factor RimM [Methylococcales bacterium]
MTLGKISGVFGINGALKIFSFTQPSENILTYPTWILEKDGKQTEVTLVRGRRQGKTLVAQLKNISDRNEALVLVGSEIQIHKTSLPTTEENEYYWHDLIGLKVETLEGNALGRVDSILETGANDVLIIKGDKEHLIPFLQPQVIVNINLQTGLMQVDWDTDL